MPTPNFDTFDSFLTNIETLEQSLHKSWPRSKVLVLNLSLDCQTHSRSKSREGVGTSTIRTSTGQKFQNVERVFLVDQNIENQKDQNVENVF